MDIDDAATRRGKRRPRTEEDNEVQRFLRSATEAELHNYTSISGAGVHARKKVVRDAWKARLSGGTAELQETTTESNTDWKIGEWCNYLAIAEREGGLMDRSTGMHCATAYCKFAELKTGMVAFDRASDIVKFLHFKSGVNEKLTKCRTQLLKADIDMAPEVVIKQTTEASAKPKSEPTRAIAANSGH